MMEVEKRIETFGVQVDDLPDELKGRRRISGGSGDSGVHGVILEEDEDSRDGKRYARAVAAAAEGKGARQRLPLTAASPALRPTSRPTPSPTPPRTAGMREGVGDIVETTADEGSIMTIVIGAVAGV